MKKPLAVILPLCLAALCPSRSHAQVSYSNWNFLIRAANAQLTDSLAMPGVRGNATPDYDNQYDIPRPPRPPSGNFLEVYFPHTGGNYPPILGTKYAVDFQSPDDPTWILSVEASGTGPLTLSWDSVYVNSIDPRVQLVLCDLLTGSLTDMRHRASYSFNYTAKRNFQIIGTLKVSLKYLMEGFWNGTHQTRDTVTGYLAGTTFPNDFVDSAQVLLSDSGTGMLVFHSAPPGDYYLAVHHRNHLEVWSSATISVAKGTSSSTRYDFTVGADRAFGAGALRNVGGMYVSWAGDVNQDGIIDFLDRNLTWNNRGQTGYLSTDCTGDNITNVSDYSLVLDNRLKIRQRP